MIPIAPLVLEKGGRTNQPINITPGGKQADL